MQSPTKLTTRQQQIRELIQNTISQKGAPPTRVEIAQALGFKSANAAEDHLQALAKKGVIELIGGMSRGIRLTNQAASAITSRLKSATSMASASSALTLPLVGRVAAGSPILAQEHITQSYSIEPTLFHKTPDYLLRVRGMSMRDAGILDGDLLAVHATQEVKNGQIVVARLGDEVTVKRLKRNKATIELLPENPDFLPIIVHPNEHFAIEGLAVGLIRNAIQL